jgi:cell division inhibitor SepF
MGARDYWDRMLVYFGIVDDAPEATRDEQRGRRVSVAGDEWDEQDDDDGARRPARRRPQAPTAARRSSGPGGVGVVPPRTFNDAQAIADQFKRGLPVIVNLQSTDGELAKRLIDFASGLTYGLDGGMQRIADKVFLLTPPDVEVSDEDRAAMLEGGFFNQS